MRGLSLEDRRSHQMNSGRQIDTTHVSETIKGSENQSSRSPRLRTIWSEASHPTSRAKPTTSSGRDRVGAFTSGRKATSMTSAASASGTFRKKMYRQLYHSVRYPPSAAPD